MELQIKKMPANFRPEPPPTDPRMYELLGEAGVRKMVSDHYDLMIESEIKELFPPKGFGLEQAKERSADFFVQRLGGPDYFNQNRGAPKLSDRHKYFKITPEGRMVWLECYREVLQKIDLPEDIIIKFWNYLHDFSNWMVNTPSSEKDTYHLA